MPRDPTPIVFSFDLFSFWAAASPKETPKKKPGGEFYFCLGSPIAMLKKTRSHIKWDHGS